MAKKTKADPSGQRVNRVKSTKRLTNRLNRAGREILRDFRAIPRKRRQQKVIQNASAVLYLYDRSPDDAEMMRLSIQSHLDSELETARATLPPDWWFKTDIELPYRQGTMEEVRDVSALLAGAVVSGTVTRGVAPIVIPPEAVLFSPEYQDGLRSAYARNYGEIKTLSEKTAQDVYRVINDGIDAGLTPSEITTSIKQRFKVAGSNAKRIVNTEVNRAYNDARLFTTEIMREQTGQNIAIFHISSLLPTTRDHHAARHGNIYTPEQQHQWWNTGANRINCHCTTRGVLLDKSGNIIESELQRELKDQRNA